MSDKLTESNKKLSEIANKNELLECEIHDYPRKLALEILQWYNILLLYLIYLNLNNIFYILVKEIN